MYSDVWSLVEIERWSVQNRIAAVELFIKTVCYSYTGWFPTVVSDLAVPGYFLWGYVKSKVYETRPANTDHLKQRIRECTQGIPKEMLQRVMTAFLSRLQECIERHVGHLQSVIFKQQ
jgi:hypothetical protein